MFPLYVPSDRSDNIFGLFRYVYVIARLWGYVSFNVNLNNVPLQSKVKVSLINCLLLVVQASVYVFCIVVNFTYHSGSKAIVSPLVSHGVNKLNEFGMACGLLFILADIVNRQRIWRIFQKFMHFDRELLFIVSAITINYKKEKRTINLYVAILVTLTALVSIYSIVIYNKFQTVTTIILAYSVVLWVTGIYICILSIFSFLLQNVRIRFRVLNKTLRRTFKANRKVTELKVIEGDACDTIIKLAKLHGQLNDIIDDANACYSIQVMLCFAAMFSYLVFGIYSLYRIWFLIDNIFENKEFLMTTVYVIWSIFYLWLGLVVIHLGSSTVSEAQLTGVIVHECINITHDHIIVERLLAFSQQLLHRAPDANCKLFSFDWTLIFSIIAATVTYLMILIQFDASNNKAHELAVNYCTATQIQNNNTTS